MKWFFTALAFCYSLHSFAYATDSTVLTERDKALADIQVSFKEKSTKLDATICRLDNQMIQLDSQLARSGAATARIDKLVERMQLLEARQAAMEANELNVYEANYQSAIVNLVSMDRDIKPLLLFQSTRDFFNSLTDVSNPMTYDGYQAGFSKFKSYIERCKDQDEGLKTVGNVISASGSISFGIPLVGVYSQLLFGGMAKYVNSINHRKRELKAQAQDMFAITTVLSQFTTDKNLVENEWGFITESLSGMQVNYDSVLSRNLRMLNVPKCDIAARFTQESDASKRYAFLSELRQDARQYVDRIRMQQPKDWKDLVYYQLMDVQLMKQQYGGLTSRIRQHINKYDVLLAKYKTNKNIGPRIVQLDEKLNQLKATFDQTFEPEQYAHAALQMYKVL